MCNFNYCTGDYEVVNNRCIRKCSAFTNYKSVKANSNPLLCIVSLDNKEVTRFYRTENYRETNEYNIYHRGLNLRYNVNLLLPLVKNNREGNNGCECPSGNFNYNNKCYINCTSPYKNKIVDGSASCEAKVIVDKKMSRNRCTILKGGSDHSACLYCPDDKGIPVPYSNGCKTSAKPA